MTVDTWTEMSSSSHDPSHYLKPYVILFSAPDCSSCVLEESEKQFVFAFERNQSGKKPARATRGQSDQADWQIREYINISGESSPSSTMKPCVIIMWALKGSVNPHRRGDTGGYLVALTFLEIPVIQVLT